MCVGGKAFKSILPLAAIAATAYFTGGGSLGSLFGAKAAAGSGAALSSVAPTAGVGAFTGSTLAPAALTSSGGIASALGSQTGIGAALGFLKDNAYLVGQGLNAAGTAANYVSNRQMLGDIGRAKSYADARNGELTAEAMRINQQSLDNFSVGNQNAVLGGAADRRIAALQGSQINPYSTFLPDGGSAPKEVKEANATRIAEIVDFGRNQLASGAKLGAYTDLNASNSLALADSGQKINTLQNFAQGNNAVLDSQLNTALIKPRGASTIGAALKGGGLLANVYASTRPKIT